MSTYNLNDNNDRLKYRDKIFEYLDKRCIVELTECKKTRSLNQNKALHLFFTFISDSLNDIGHTFKYHGLVKSELECRYTPNLVKETLWRPIQIALFNIESTKDINTVQMNEIADTIIKYFSDRGYSINFPNIQSLYYSKYGSYIYDR